MSSKPGNLNIRLFSQNIVAKSLLAVDAILNNKITTINRYVFEIKLVAWQRNESHCRTSSTISSSIAPRVVGRARYYWKTFFQPGRREWRLSEAKKYSIRARCTDKKWLCCSIEFHGRSIISLPAPVNWFPLLKAAWIGRESFSISLPLSPAVNYIDKLHNAVSGWKQSSKTRTPVSRRICALRTRRKFHSPAKRASPPISTSRSKRSF